MSSRILTGDVLDKLRTLPDNSVQCVVTSPPYYGLRDYGVPGQIGLEPTPAAYVARMVEVFREVRRVLREDGVCWLNLGDSYASCGGPEPVQTCNAQRDGGSNSINGGNSRKVANGLKPKDLVGIPWRVAFALQEDGWWLRSEITWCKKAPMPESVTDRPTSATEKVFLLTKASRYFYDAVAVAEPSVCEHPSGNGYKRDARQTYRDENGARGSDDQWKPTSTRNMRNYWLLGPEPYKEAHFAVMPTKLVEPCILAGTSAHGCCPECGAPWERVVEHTQGDTEACDRPKRTAGMDSKTSTLSLSGNGSKEWAERGARTTTTGWRATCAHDAAPIPCTVLDPFAGSGTTLAVALALGRNAIGIELNPEYVKLAERRLAGVTPALFGV